MKDYAPLDSTKPAAVRVSEKSEKWKPVVYTESKPDIADVLGATGFFATVAVIVVGILCL